MVGARDLGLAVEQDDRGLAEIECFERGRGCGKAERTGECCGRTQAAGQLLELLRGFPFGASAKPRKPDSPNGRMTHMG
jgi:hypothetical protein